jgi:hypothetical protein
MGTFAISGIALSAASIFAARLIAIKPNPP